MEYLNKIIQGDCLEVLKSLPDNSVDLIVTSPPYGDSRTTVAYGQYSRLSAVWLGLEEPGRVDGRLMGGKTRQNLDQFPSPALNMALGQIESVAPERAREVAACEGGTGTGG